MQSKKTALLFIFITILVDVIGIGIILPIIPDLIMELTGEGTAQAVIYGMWLTTAFAGMQFLFSPVLGEISDKYGRRPILLIALLGLSIDYLIHAWAPTIMWLFVGRFLAGITGASFTVASAYIADISTNEEKAKNFGLIGAAFGLGFIIGPAIGGFFGDIDIRLPFYIAAGLTFTNFVFGYFFVPESLTTENRRPIELKKMIPGVSLVSLRKYKGVLLLITAFFLANLAGQANIINGSWLIGGHCARVFGGCCCEGYWQEKNHYYRLSIVDHWHVSLLASFRTLDVVRLFDSLCLWGCRRPNYSRCDFESSI